MCLGFASPVLLAGTQEVISCPPPCWAVGNGGRSEAHCLSSEHDVSRQPAHGNPMVSEAPLFTQSFLLGGIRRERGAAAVCTQLAQLQLGPDGHTPAHGSAAVRPGHQPSSGIIHTETPKRGSTPPRCSLLHRVQPPKPGSRSSASACSRLTYYHFPRVLFPPVGVRTSEP